MEFILAKKDNVWLKQLIVLKVTRITESKTLSNYSRYFITVL